MLYLTYKIMWVMCMIKKQETMILSEYTGIYDLVVPIVLIMVEMLLIQYECLNIFY